PTNHLDLPSKEVLEAALLTFTGTIVFISHDRYFINRVATRVVEVDRGRLTSYLGGYDDYLERKAPAPAEAAAAAPPTPPPAARAAPAPSPRASGARNRRVSAELKAIRGRLTGVEAKIQELEARLAEIGLALSDPDLYRDARRVQEITRSRKETEEQVAW